MWRVEPAESSNPSSPAVRLTPAGGGARIARDGGTANTRATVFGVAVIAVIAAWIVASYAGSYTDRGHQLFIWLGIVDPPDCG